MPSFFRNILNKQAKNQDDPSGFIFAYQLPNYEWWKELKKVVLEVSYEADTQIKFIKRVKDSGLWEKYPRIKKWLENGLDPSEFANMHALAEEEK